MSRFVGIFLTAVLMAGVASAGIVASYTTGVAPTAGTTGAADPATQGWTASTATPGGYNYGADSTIGGWRITDGTSGGNFFYQLTLSGSDAANLGSQDWTATWTSAIHADAVSSSGVPNGVDDYYTPPNESRQNNNAFWIESAGNFRYILTYTIDANGDYVLTDGTSNFQITVAGNQQAQELGAGAPSVNYVTYALASVGGTVTLTDSLGGNHGVVASSAGSQDRVVWGATSSSGQGSTVWSGVSVDVIPEPSVIVLTLIGGLGMALRRKRS